MSDDRLWVLDEQVKRLAEENKALRARVAELERERDDADDYRQLRDDAFNVRDDALRGLEQSAERLVKERNAAGRELAAALGSVDSWRERWAKTARRMLRYHRWCAAWKALAKRYRAELEGRDVMLAMSEVVIAGRTAERDAARDALTWQLPEWHEGAPPELRPGMLVECSTRDPSSDAVYSDTHFVADGGGAYCECCLSRIPAEKITRWAQLPYPEDPR